MDTGFLQNSATKSRQINDTGALDKLATRNICEIIRLFGKFGPTLTSIMWAVSIRLYCMSRGRFVAIKIYEDLTRACSAAVCIAMSIIHFKGFHH